MQLTKDSKIPVSELEAGIIISEGTLNEKSILTKEICFINELEGSPLKGRMFDIMKEFHPLSIAVSAGEETAETWEQIGSIREEMTNIMQFICPDGWSYESHPGDPACVGFFRDEDDEDDEVITCDNCGATENESEVREYETTEDDVFFPGETSGACWWLCESCAKDYEHKVL